MAGGFVLYVCVVGGLLGQNRVGNIGRNVSISAMPETISDLLTVVGSKLKKRFLSVSSKTDTGFAGKLQVSDRNLQVSDRNLQVSARNHPV